MIKIILLKGRSKNDCSFIYFNITNIKILYDIQIGANRTDNL